MGKQYGVPYMGSKQLIAEFIISHLPSGRRFCDLFAGGCALTHRALLSRKYERFLMQDVAPSGPTLFLDAIHGKYRNESRWISREDFHRLRHTDPYVKYCWSFGNAGDTYIYGKEIEPFKKAVHYAIFFHDYSLPMPEPYNSLIDLSRIDKAEGVKARRLAARKVIQEALKGRKEEQFAENTHHLINNERLASMTQLSSLESGEKLCRAQSLESLERLERLESLEFKCASYEEYEHEEGDVVVADIPYSTAMKDQHKERYTGGFDHARFFEWARTREYPVFVCEYSAPDDFIPVASISKRNTFNDKLNIRRTENMFVHERFAESERRGQLEFDFGI